MSVVLRLYEKMIAERTWPESYPLVCRLKEWRVYNMEYTESFLNVLTDVNNTYLGTIFDQWKCTDKYPSNNVSIRYIF